MLGALSGVFRAWSYAVDGTIAPSSAECYIVSVDLGAVNPPTVLVKV